jgi:hypothetical protein
VTCQPEHKWPESLSAPPRRSRPRNQNRSAARHESCDHQRKAHFRLGNSQHRDRAGKDPGDLIGRLEAEWPALAAGAVGQRLAIWSEQERVLAGFASPQQLLRHLLGRHSTQPPKDAVLAALVRQARLDPLAARVVLQALLPGLKAIAGRLLLEADERDELWSALLAHCWERIRRYPLERRPARIAANTLLDTLQKTSRELKRQRRTRDQPAGDLTPERLAGAPVDPDVERLLARAVAAAAISEEEAELIVCTRIDNADLHALAREQGVSYHALNTRRLRAEKRLLLYLGYGAVTFRGPRAPFSSARAVGAGLTGSAGRGAATDHQQRR